MNLLSRRRQIMAKKSEEILPSGYLMLDYISNGNTAASAKEGGPRIDTGLLPNDANWQFIGSWSRNGSIVGYGAIFAAYTGDTNNSYRIISNNASTSKVAAGAHCTPKSMQSYSLSNSDAGVWHTFDLKRGTLVLDGESLSLSTTTGSALTDNLFLADGRFPLKLGRFKAYHDNTLVADMIPCKRKSDNKIGMYDIVREQFFASANQYDFIY